MSVTKHNLDEFEDSAKKKFEEKGCGHHNWLEITQTSGQLNKQQRLIQFQKQPKSTLIGCDIIVN